MTVDSKKKKEKRNTLFYKTKKRGNKNMLCDIESLIKIFKDGIVNKIRST